MSFRQSAGLLIVAVCCWAASVTEVHGQYDREQELKDLTNKLKSKDRAIRIEAALELSWFRDDGVQNRCGS
jgi:hypothetical protein